MDKDSKEAKKFLKDREKSDSNASSSSGSSGGVGAIKRPGGIASIMNVISGKKQKMGCLDKSKLDWNNFVKEEGIKEELETHNKGKDGSVYLKLELKRHSLFHLIQMKFICRFLVHFRSYVEKLEFLERADHRRFEMEKEAREKTRKTLNR